MGLGSSAPDRATVHMAQRLFAIGLAVVLIGSVIFAVGIMYGPQWFDDTSPFELYPPATSEPTPTPVVSPQLYDSPNLGWIEGSNSTNFTNATAIERRIYAYINAERVAYRQEPLVYNPELAQIARNWSHWSTKIEKPGHFTPDGIGPRDRAMNAGYECDKALGENVVTRPTMQRLRVHNSSRFLFLDTPDKIARYVTQEFMSSPGHRWGMLSPRNDVIGVGVYVTENDTVYVTEMFCERSEPWDRAVNASTTDRFTVRIADERAIRNESNYAGLPEPPTMPLNPFTHHEEQIVTPHEHNRSEMGTETPTPDSG